MKPKPLNKHAQEMLALIASRSGKTDRSYWMPNEKNEFVKFNGKALTVFVSAPWSTGAIRTLTARGLVETPKGAADKWARRVTDKGRDVLSYYELLNEFS